MLRRCARPRRGARHAPLVGWRLGRFRLAVPGTSRAPGSRTGRPVLGVRDDGHVLGLGRRPTSRGPTPTSSPGRCCAPARADRPALREHPPVDDVVSAGRLGCGGAARSARPRPRLSSIAPAARAATSAGDRYAARVLETVTGAAARGARRRSRWAGRVMPLVPGCGAATGDRSTPAEPLRSTSRSGSSARRRRRVRRSRGRLATGVRTDRQPTRRGRRRRRTVPRRALEHVGGR